MLSFASCYLCCLLNTSQLFTVNFILIFWVQVLAANQRRHQAGQPAPVIPRYSKVRSSLNRVRASLVPEVPTTLADVVVPVDYATTWMGENFLLHQDNGEGVLVFGTDSDLQLLGDCDTIFLDGTFKTG